MLLEWSMRYEPVALATLTLEQNLLLSLPQISVPKNLNGEDLVDAYKKGTMKLLISAKVLLVKLVTPQNMQNLFLLGTDEEFLECSRLMQMFLDGSR